MRIGLLAPLFWPQVRRGTERLVHDLGAALAESGHEVTVVASHRGRTKTESLDGMEVVLYRRLPTPKRLALWEDHVVNVPQAFLRSWGGSFDLVHAFFPAEGWAAIKARERGGPPVVVSYHGIPERGYLVRRRYRLEMVNACASRADAFSVLSEAARVETKRLLHVDPVVLPGGVNLDEFERAVQRSETPTVICAASLWDRRKRAGILFEAWGEVRRSLPHARLLLTRQRDPLASVRSDLDTERVELADGASLPLPEGTEWVEADGTRQLADLYAAAWTSVLPAVDEAFGLVMIESLAGGTPVVAARSGSCPEVLSAPEHGSLFEPDDPQDLAANLVQALEASPSPETANACRSRAAEFSWPRVVTEYETVYAEVMGR